MNATFQPRLGPRRAFIELTYDDEELERIVNHAKKLLRNNKEKPMHYRNGREAKNGDKVIKLSYTGGIVGFGVLHSAVAGNDFCNGGIAPITSDQGACLCDCLHVDDLAELLKEKGWDKRPDGK